MNDGSWALYMPGTHTAIVQWLSCLVYVLCMPTRVRGWRLWGAMALSLAVLYGTHAARGYAAGAKWIVSVTSAALETGLIPFFLCRISGTQAVYLWARSFLFAEFAASLEWEAVYYVSYFLQRDSRPYVPLIMLVCYALCYVPFLLFERQSKRRTQLGGVLGKDAFTAVAITVAAFCLGNISFGFRDSMYAESLGIGMLTVRTMAFLAGIVMLLTQNEMRREMALQFELEGLNSLFLRQYEQYRRYRANDETIRAQYHDLKHKIAVIRAERDPVKQDGYLREMDEAIELYQTHHQTGHPVVDTVLSGKDVECREKGVKLLSYADAAALSFVDAMDLCAIFGNALDNAVECAEKLADPEQRVVKVYVYTQNQFVVIRFENFYDRALHFEDGLPRTTKENRQMHGFGLRSIRGNAEKYGGTISVHADNGAFRLVVLLPMQKAI